MNKLIYILSLFSFTVLTAQQFTKIEDQSPVTDGGDSRSVNWIDYDSDGDLDLFITNGPNPGENNFLYRNDNGNFFKIKSNAIASDFKASDGSSWGDYNNDGNPDLFVGNWWNQNNLLYTNTGNGNFLLSDEKPSTENSYSESGSWGDFNNDGFLDLYVANSAGSRKNFMYLNNGDGRFTKIIDGDIVNDAFASRSVDWIDYDNDGTLDLYSANEGNSKNSLYKNNGDNTFSKITDLALVAESNNSFSSSWADYDNDGDFDLFVANFDFNDNELYRNDGNGLFTKLAVDHVTNSRGYSISSTWGDVDNDGDLDLFVANAFSGNFATNNFFYLNNGDGTFTRDNGILTKNNGWSYSGEFGDFNKDGYLDLATANCFNASENNSIYLNNGGSNNWIILDLEGNISNKSAIGSIVILKANISGSNVIQTRRVAGQSGYCAQNLQLHFGLGDAAIIDSIIVQWPSGQKTVLSQETVNQFLTISEPIPENYISANFKADVVTGPDQTTVNFTDLSVECPNTPITSWQWDFDNDGIADSDEPNPSYTYSSSSNKSFSVKLSVSNGSNSSEKIREDYITISGTTGIKEQPVSNEFVLSQNYPNPFNPATKISFSIPESENLKHVKLSVYDVLGNNVATLFNGRKPSGSYTVDFNAGSLSSGIYFYTLQLDNRVLSKKMLLLK